MLELIKKYFYLPIIIVIALLIFWDLPKTFYQQDEWQAIGHNLVQGINNIIFYTTPEQLLLGGGRPLSRALNLILLNYFKFEIFPIAAFAVAIHIINSALVFLLAKKLFNKTWISFTASLFFMVSSVSSQAVTWAAAVGGLPATTFLILSVIFFIEFLKSEKRNVLYASYFLGLISLLFKESALFLFILFPLTYFTFKEKIKIKEAISVHLPLLFYGILIGIFRYLGLFFRSDNAVGFVNAGESPIKSAIVHVILYPLTSIFQIFVPPTDLYNLTPQIIKIQYKFLIDSPARDLVAQSIAADMVSVIGAFLILGLTLLLIYRLKDRTTKKGIIFCLAFFFLSFLPYMVVHRESSYLSSRYFYVGAVTASILFGFVVYYLSNLNKFVKILIIPLVIVFLYHHASIIRTEINYQEKIGLERIKVLNGIKEIYPNPDNNSIFYVISDKNYYGNITNPFQNGLGYVLQVWYFDTGKIPKAFLEENYLWDLGAEGYKSKGALGFGYYQDIDKMIDEINIKKLEPEMVHGFFIDSNNQAVIDITKETRERVSSLSAEVND